MAYDPPECTHRQEAVGNYCLAPSVYLVMTQMPPYRKEYTCGEHLLICINDLLGHQSVPVLVRRVWANEIW